MTIAYPLTLPDIPTPQQVTFSEVDIVGFNQSPFSGVIGGIQDWGQGFWSAQLQWSRITNRAKAAPLRAVITALRGPVGTILLGDPIGRTPRGVGGGSPICDGAVSVRSRILKLRGLPPNTAGWLKADDYLQIGSGAQTRLYKTLRDVDSDGAGKATLDIWPPIRDGYADAATVAITNCLGTFRLGVARRDWQLSGAFTYANTLPFIEAL